MKHDRNTKLKIVSLDNESNLCGRYVLVIFCVKILHVLHNPLLATEAISHPRVIEGTTRGQ